MKQLIFILVIVMACFSCQPVEPSRKLQPLSTPNPAPAKQVISNTLPLVEQWRWQGKIFTGSWYPPATIVTKNHIIVEWQDADSNRKIVALNVHTGSLTWESEDIWNLKSLHTEGSRVYAGTIRHVQSFDLKTGESSWKGVEQEIDKKGFLYVYPKGNELEVYDFSENRLYLVDADTGQTLEEVTYPFIFFKNEDMYYSGCGYGYKTHCLIATDESSGETLWSYEFEGLIYLWPTFKDDLMLINAGGEIIAIDAKTGDIIWQTTDTEFVTGVALGNNVAYAIRTDAAIVGFDPKTGDQIGIIEMSPNRTREDDGGYVTHYAISASDKFVSAYYGNSQELIVFEKVDE